MGLPFFKALKKEFSCVQVIAEDLGCCDDDLKMLLEKTGFPTMKVLQFAFDTREPSDYLPHTYEKNTV